MEAPVCSSCGQPMQTAEQQAARVEHFTEMMGELGYIFAMADTSGQYGALFGRIAMELEGTFLGRQSDPQWRAGIDAAHRTIFGGPKTPDPDTSH